MMVHLIPYVVDTIGSSVQSASIVAATMAGTQLFGQFGGGFVSDRVDKRKVIVVCMIGHTVALVGLAFTTSLALIYFLVTVHGLAWGVRGPLMAAIRADYFGRHSFATIMGFASMIAMIGMIIGPIVAGLAADILGSYTWGFFALGIIPAIGAVFFYLAKKPELAIVSVAPRPQYDKG
jgi:MFS family permease